MPYTQSTRIMDEIKTLMVSVIKTEQVKEECTDWEEWQSYIEEHNYDNGRAKYDFNCNIQVPHIKEEHQPGEKIDASTLESVPSEQIDEVSSTSEGQDKRELAESEEGKLVFKSCEHGIYKVMPENSLHPSMIYPFSCHVCAKPYFRRGFLEKHFLEHTIDLSCSKCHETFESHSLFLKHLLNESRVQMCDCNDAMYKSKKIPLKTSECTDPDGNDPVFKCNECTRTFHQRQVFVRHTLTHSAKKMYKCDNCGKEFSYSDVYKRHLLIHTDILPFKCIVCGKTFRQQSTLNKHSRVHSGLKPYKCKVCEKEFSQSSSLTRHSFRHTGEKAFTCAECGRGFTRKGHIRDHIISVHNMPDRKSVV